MPAAIVHRVSIRDPKAHHVHVETTISLRASAGPAADDALPETLVFFMPVWTPGSYLVREYARSVEGFAADAPAHAVKIRKNAWRVETRGADPVVVRYRVYANELTVRTNHVDDTHAFLVGAALFVGVEGKLDLPTRIELDAPTGWRAATSLPQGLADTKVPGHSAARPGWNTTEVMAFEAQDFDTLVDSPIEVGLHRDERFDVLGTPHRYVIWPPNAVGEADLRRLVDDTRTLLEQEARLFGGSFPYPAYDLLLHLSPRGRGGLEHANSSALIAPATSFATREGYLDLLSLVSHEAFHAWNVKRIRPAGLTPYRYEEESYTRLLWWFEGGTSYYDWRVLALAHLCTIDEYLDHLAAEIAYLDQTPGRLVQPLEDASFDAWIKLYRPDENSPNSAVSYYRKGELVCALIDLEIRGRTGGRATLDRVLLRLWEDYGARRRPVPEDGLQSIFESIAEVPLADVFDTWIRSAGEVDCSPTLARVGLAVERSSRPDAAPCSLGVRLRNEAGRAVVSSVTRDGAAARAGIDPGDEILGVGDTRIDGANVEAALRTHGPGEQIVIWVARDGKLSTRHATLDPPRHDRVKIVAQRDAAPSAKAAFTAWLGGSHPAWSKERTA